MSTGLALLIFAVSLGATLFAASVFAERLDVLGHRLQLPEALIGVLTAAGADAPELSSAVVALAQGSHAVGVGVVVGSNVFNIAAMLGLSAVVVGRVRLAPEALALEGGVALLDHRHRRAARLRRSARVGDGAALSCSSSFPTGSSSASRRATGRSGCRSGSGGICAGRWAARTAGSPSPAARSSARCS